MSSRRLHGFSLTSTASVTRSLTFTPSIVVQMRTLRILREKTRRARFGAIHAPPAINNKAGPEPYQQSAGLRSLSYRQKSASDRPMLSTSHDQLEAETTQQDLEEFVDALENISDGLSEKEFRDISEDIPNGVTETPISEPQPPVGSRSRKVAAIPAETIPIQSLSYWIPKEMYEEARKQNTPWSYSLYRNKAGQQPEIRYCKTKDQSERIAKLFLNEKVLGFDLEWMIRRPGWTVLQDNVSLIQLASESRIALFQIALHRGKTAEELMPPTLKRILESSDIIKVGVSINADCTRLEKKLKTTVQGRIELSNLHKLVRYALTEPGKVNRSLVSLEYLTLEHIGLALAKPEVRTGEWNKSLNSEQIKYAAADAYIAVQLYSILNDKRLAMSPTPAMPEFAEHKKPLLIPDPESESEMEAASETEDAIQLGDESETDYGSFYFPSDDETFNNMAESPSSVPQITNEESGHQMGDRLDQSEPGVSDNRVQNAGRRRQIPSWSSTSSSTSSSSFSLSSEEERKSLPSTNSSRPNALEQPSQPARHQPQPQSPVPSSNQEQPDIDIGTLTQETQNLDICPDDAPFITFADDERAVSRKRGRASQDDEVEQEKEQSEVGDENENGKAGRKAPSRWIV